MPRWPWDDLDLVRPPIAITCPKFEANPVINAPMTLRLPWTCSAPNCHHMYQVWGQSSNKMPQWPWDDFELVWHSIAITCTKFEANPVINYPMTLGWPWTSSAPNCDHMYIVWGSSSNKCPDDLEMTLSLFGLQLWSHVHSLGPIQ